MVLGRAVAASELRPAELPGYVAVLAEEERLPVLVPRAAGIVHGVVAEIPDRHERDRVTFFEETEYRPEVKEVRLLEGGTVRALVHTDTSLATEAREQWSFERWRREDKAQMLVSREAGCATSPTATTPPPTRSGTVPSPR